MRRRDAVRAALALLLTATPAASAAQPTTRLLGRVVDLQGGPVSDVRLRIVGHGEPTVFGSGEFELQLAGQPVQVHVGTIGGEVTVVYPVDGLLAVPRDPTVRVTVVVARPERAVISDVLAARFVQLEETLRRNGVRYDAGADSLGRDVRRILSLLEVREDSLRHSIERQRRQADLKPVLFAALDRYLLELKDLRDAFRHIAPMTRSDPVAVTALQQAITEYNDAFVAIDTMRHAVAARIAAAWEPQRAELLQRDLEDVFTELVEGIHQAHVLALYRDVVVLQRARGRDAAPRAEVEAAVRAATAAAQQIDGRIGVLEQRYQRLRQALEQS